MRPQRRPQHERHARPAGAEVRGERRDAPGEARDHRAVVARQPRDVLLARPDDRERQVLLLARAAAVADVAADQREHHVLALVQRLERADAERRRVVGDEEDGLHRSASS